MTSLTGLLLMSSALADDDPGSGEGGLVGTWPVPLAPVGNEQDPVKARLGKLLFWEEQVSFDRTMSCGTCHIPSAGGSDPRTKKHPTGPLSEGLFGSPGVIRQDTNGAYVVDAKFELEPQITRRLSPTPIGAAFFEKLFWDVSADEDFTFRDVNGNAVTLTDSAALESLSVRPPISPVEMGHDGMGWDEIESSLGGLEPMALASNLQGDFIVNPGETYADLFQQAFGSPEVTQGRFAMAVAQYMRTLIANDAPIDHGFANLTSEARTGFSLFNTISSGGGNDSGCIICHQVIPDPTNFSPIEVDSAGFFVEDNDYLFTSGTTADALNDPDLAFAKMPSLRNLSLMPRLESQGSFAGLEDALDSHYLVNDGTEITFGDTAPLFRTEIMAFFDALVDQRVADEVYPFDKPQLFSERVPFKSNLRGVGSNLPNTPPPIIIANTPPQFGNTNFKFGVGRVAPGAKAYLYVSDAMVPQPSSGTVIQWEIDRGSSEFGLVGMVTLIGQTEIPGFGVGTLQVDVLDPSLIGQTRYYQWIVEQPGAPGGFATTQVASHTYF